MITRIREHLGLHRLTMGRLVGSALLNSLGVVTVAVGLWAILFPAQTIHSLQEAAQAGAIGLQNTELLLHVALSTCFWAMLVILFRLFTLPRKPRVISARGSIYVETIVVVPVFLLLNLGLIQLTILNSASLLTSLAAFKAGRAVSLWHPEAMEGRKGVTTDMVREKARLAAAAALAPVAPGDHFFTLSGCPTDSLENMLDGLQGAGHAPPVSLGGGPVGNLRLPTFFDSSNFMTRGQRKLRFAHCATTVDYAVSGNEVHTIVQYRHQVSMPIVAPLFGSLDTVGGRVGHYNLLERDHITTHQIPPCVRTPGGSSFSTC